MVTKVYKLFYFFPAMFPATTIAGNLYRDPIEALKWSPLFCPLHALTGWLCPTCGLGRSLFYAFRLEFDKSFHFHFLGPIIVGLLSIGWVFFIWNKPINVSFSKINSRYVSLIVLFYVLYGIHKNL